MGGVSAGDWREDELPHSPMLWCGPECYRKINLRDSLCYFRVPCLFLWEEEFSPLISYHGTSIKWLAKDRGHTISDGNQNCLVAKGISCLLPTDGRAAGVCTLLRGGHVNTLFFLVIEPVYDCKEGDKEVWKDTKASWAICPLQAWEPRIKTTSE